MEALIGLLVLACMAVTSVNIHFAASYLGRIARALEARGEGE